MTLRLWLLAVLLLAACAPHWQARSVPPCFQPLPDPRDEVARASLAAVLALEARGYAIARRGSQITATAGATRLSLTVTAEGAIVIDAPSGRADGRESDAVQQGIATFRCRALADLRDEASRSNAAPSSGGQQTPVQRIADLVEARAHLHVGRKIAFVAIAAGVAAAGVSVGVDAIWFHYGGCDPLASRVECGENAVKALAIVGGTMVAAGGVMLGVALPRLFGTLRRYRELGRELRVLRSTQLALGPNGSLGVSFRASF